VFKHYIPLNKTASLFLHGFSTNRHATVWKYILAHSKNELIQRRCVRRLSVCPSVYKLLRKSLLLAGKWPDRHQTWTRWTPGQRASRVWSRSRSRSKVTWYAHFLGFLEWATPSLTVWLKHTSLHANDEILSQLDTTSASEGLWPHAPGGLWRWTPPGKVRPPDQLTFASLRSCYFLNALVKNRLKTVLHTSVN